MLALLSHRPHDHETGAGGAAAALFLVLDYARMLNGTHHWFSVLAVMGALAILLKARTPSRIAIAGALLGVATFFTQTRGPMAALGVGGYLIWDQFQTKDSWSAGFKRLLSCSSRSSQRGVLLAATSSPKWALGNFGIFKLSMFFAM